jgi:hypothetical protein
MRSAFAPVHPPTLILAVGRGAVVPVAALAARDVGASVAVAGGPLAVAGVDAATSLATAPLVVGGIGLAGAAVVLLGVPEPLHRTASPRTGTTAVG